MGADSCSSSGWNERPLAIPKIISRPDMLIGITGSVRAINLIQYRLKLEPQKDVADEEYITTVFVDAVKSLFKEHGHSSIKDNQENSEDSLLVGYRGNLFEIESNFQVVRYSSNFAAVGVGENYALGAMEVLKGNPKERITKALEIVSKYSMGVAPPFMITCLKKHGGLWTTKP